MTDKELGKIMYDRAIAFLDKRFPTDWGGCAIMYTEDKQFLISTALESFNAAACLCMETGAMCEAQKYNLKVTHSLCLSRENENETPKILTACGICRERLRYWGDGVKIAISNPENKVIFKTLKQLDPCYWGNVFEDKGADEYAAGIYITRED